MDSLISGGAGGIGGIEKKTFLNHMFSSTEESKAEFLNIIQYSLFAFVPVVLLNKSVQYIFPDVDFDKSSFFILAEIFLQIFFIFFGILFIHRFISFFNSFSGFKFDSPSNFILPFFVIIFSIHSKLSNKINLIFFRAKEVLGFTNDDEEDTDYRSNHKNTKIYSGTNKISNANKQYDTLSHPQQPPIQPPIISESSNDSYYGPMAANSILGSSF